MKNRLFAIVCIILIAITLFPCIISAAPAPTPPTTTDEVEDDKDSGIGIIDGLISLGEKIMDLPNYIAEEMLKKLWEIINDSVGNVIIANITFYLDAFVSFVKQGDPVFSDTTVSNIYTIMKPVAYSLISLFFIMGLAKNAMYFEVTSFEIVLKAAIMLIVGKYLVDSGIWILKSICSVNTYLATQILNSSNTNITALYNLNGSYSSATASITGTTQALGSGILFFLFAIIALLCAVSIFIVLILRQIQLGVLICAAPLFFSTIVADISNEVFKAFIKHFFAVAFQTTFMSIALALFCGSIKSFLSGTSVGMGGGFVGMLVGIIGLSFYMVKTPSTINSILGVHGGGGGLNVASIAALFI